MKRGPKPKLYDSAKAGLWFKAVVTPKARCAVCGTPKGLQAHHVVGKTWLEVVARSLRMDNEERNVLLWDERNGMALCTPCHEAHTNAARRVKRSAIPAATWAFVRHVDDLLGTQAASVRVEREYPEA